MMKGTAVFLLLAVYTMESVYAKTLPSYLKACKRKDPGLNECLKVFMETLIRRSPNGIPELKIPPLEPFVIPQVVLDQGSSQAVKLKATFNNLAVSGMTKADIIGIKAVMEPEPSFELSFMLRYIRLESDYVVDGKLLIVPIKGSGRNDANLTEVSGLIKINTKHVKGKRGDHLDVLKHEVDVDVKDGKFHFDNLFEGNKQLGATTNTFINENWHELYKELRPVIAQSIGSVVAFVMKIMLDEYTYDEMFPGM